MYICGTEGAIRADVIAGEIEVCRIGFGEKVRKVEAGASGGHGGGDDVLARDLAATMLHGAASKAGLEDGLKSAVTCFAIDDAMAGGRVVDVGPYWQKTRLGLRAAA
jgi:hypothetical protein